MKQLIVDTHVHIWNLEKVEYSWLKNDTSLLNRTYLLDELQPQLESAKVTTGILIQAANNWEDTELMLEQANLHEWISGVVGWLPLENPTETKKLINEKYLKNTLLKGVRHLIHTEKDDDWLLQPNVIESLELLAHHNIPYDLVGVNNQHIEVALKIAEKIPTLKMVFDHLNQPPIATKEQFGRWGTLMSEAAKHPNFFAKISGLGTATGNFINWKSEDIKPYIAFTLEHFDNDRCFLGGDYPVSLLAGTYASTWNSYQNIIAELLGEISAQKVFSTNAVSFYNL